MSLYWLIPVIVLCIVLASCVVDLYTRVEALEKDIIELTKPNTQL